MERYLFKQPDHKLIEVVATSYVSAQAIAGEDAVCLAVGEDEIAEFDSAFNKPIQQAHPRKKY